MAAVTTRHGPKPFTWSYSRLKNFEACPKKHYEVDITKKAKEEESDQLMWGSQVHKAMDLRCGDKRTPLPKAMELYEPWAQKIVTPGSNYFVENSMALTKDFAPCGYFDPGVWFRAKVDLIKITGRVALIVDWKTGKIKDDSVQLALSAACVFAKFPELKAVRSEYVWLQENATTSQTFKPADMPSMWRSIWPRIEALEHAHNTTTYMAKPGGLCRSWCPVRSCPHNGANT
jgi:hypothetical protein